MAEGAATSRINNTDFTQQQIDDVVAQVMASIWANQDQTIRGGLSRSSTNPPTDNNGHFF